MQFGVSRGGGHTDTDTDTDTDTHRHTDTQTHTHTHSHTEQNEVSAWTNQLEEVEICAMWVAGRHKAASLKQLTPRNVVVVVKNNHL